MQPDMGERAHWYSPAQRQHNDSTTTAHKSPLEQAIVTLSNSLIQIDILSADKKLYAQYPALPQNTGQVTGGKLPFDCLTRG
jgi:hypothetical protein